MKTTGWQVYISLSQGLDMDNVTLVWRNDLVWDEVNSKWAGNIRLLKDPAFRAIYESKTRLWKQAKWNWNQKYLLCNAFESKKKCWYLV